MIYLPDAPSLVLRSAFQGSSGSPVVTRRSSMTGPHIGQGKINVYCGNIPDPAQHTPTAESSCTGTTYTPRVQPDWVMPVACDEQSDTAKVILRTWEVVDKAGDLHLLTDTIVVFRLPRLTPGTFVNAAEDTSYCELKPVGNEGALQKSYASWKQPMGLHDYEQEYTKLKGVVYEFPWTVVVSSALAAHAGGERVWAEYLNCVILRKTDGTEFTIGDLIGYRSHANPLNYDPFATNYLQYLEEHINADQLGYGFLHGIYELGEDPLSIIGGPVLLRFFPYLLLEKGDWILSEGGNYEQVTQEWYYRGNGVSPYWFGGGWPTVECGGECVSYHDGGTAKELTCIQIQVPRLTIESGFDAENCDTICLPKGDHCGIRVESDPVSEWSDGCPQTRGSDTWITQTCWAQTPNPCAEDGAMACEELTVQVDATNAVVDYSCDTKQVEVHLSRWKTIQDTLGPIFDFCYPAEWDQAGIRDAIRRGMQSEDARNWEAENPTRYSTGSHKCEAEIFVPQVHLIDNCSGLASVKAMVAVPGGVRTVLLKRTATEARILEDGDTSLVYTYSHTTDPIRVPFGGCDGPLTEIRYEATDNCWNTNSWRKYIQVVDEVAPTVVVNTAVKAAIRNEISWIGAETLDEGSWDNCSVDLRLARRTDWTAGIDLCQNTGAHAPYTSWEDLLVDLGVDRNQVIRAANGEEVGADQFNGAYEVTDLARFLNQGEIEAYYYDQIVWLWEDGIRCGNKAIHGWVFAIARYIAAHCSQGDEHGNGLDVGDLEFIFDHLMGQPGYGQELAYLGGGWSQSVPMTCTDACGSEGSVDVELVVFDGCCNWSKGWTRVDVEDWSRPEIIKELEDITISCEAYNLFYKDIVERAAVYNDEGDLPNLQGSKEDAFAALDVAFGSYLKGWVKPAVNGGQPTDADGNVLSDSALWFDYFTVTCEEKSVTEKIADTLHDGTVQWITNVRKESYLDTIPEKGINGMISGGCSAFSDARVSAGKQDVWIDLDECGYGTITRKFFIGNGCSGYDAEQVIEQVIRVVPVCALRLSMFDVPADVGSKVEALCVPNEEAIYDLPVSLTGNAGLLPSLEDALCQAVAIGYEDEVIRVLGAGGIYQVSRTWEFMDWCDPNSQLDYVQEIIVRVDPECTNPEVGARTPDLADGIGVATRGYGDGYRLYQNHPNPFEGFTVIGFDLPVDTEARLTIYDVTGKVLKTIRSHYEKGYHEEMLVPGELPVTGVLYYRLHTDAYTATRRMVKVEE